MPRSWSVVCEVVLKLDGRAVPMVLSVLDQEQKTFFRFKRRLLAALPIDFPLPVLEICFLVIYTHNRCKI